MSNNLKVLLIGAGNMGKAYSKVLKAQNIDFKVFTRSQTTAEAFEKETGIKAISGSLEALLSNNKDVFSHVINAVSVENLVATTKQLIESNIPNILVEKPLGLTVDSVEKLRESANKTNCNIFVAYNRRYYSSVEKAISIINEDGGLKSINFEFTEWKTRIDWSRFSDTSKERWLIANSTHVIDLAFFLAGEPKKWVAYSGKSETESKDVFVGSGLTENGVYFSYASNWDAPGRWGIELLTNKHRLYLRPMEKLAIQNINSVNVDDIAIDDSLDLNYKPGIYNEVEDFLSKAPSEKLKTIQEHCNSMSIYEEILYGSIRN